MPGRAEALDARRVKLTSIVGHPRNLREDVGDVSDLVESFGEIGPVEALTVVSMEAFKTWNPLLWEEVGQGDWVIVAGHRRREALERAGYDEADVIVREELAPLQEAVKVMLGENGARTGLSPMQEARGFALLQEEGQTTREIAAARGVSHGQVSKRLKLMRLPAELAELVERPEDDPERLKVSDALKLLELPEAEQVDAYKQAQREAWRGLAGVVEYRKAARAAKRDAARIRKQLETAGVEVVEYDQVDEFITHPFWEQRLPKVTPEDVDELEDPQSVVATVRVSGQQLWVEFWRRRKPGEESASEGSTRVEAERVAERAAGAQRQVEREGELHAAAEARGAACARLLSRQVPPALAAELMADTLLADVVVEHYGIGAVAMRWCGVEPAEDADEAGQEWIEEQAAAGPAARLRAAVAVAMGDIELGLRYEHRRHAWTPRERRHVLRLAQHAGYELTADDQEQIARSTLAEEEAAAAAAEAAEQD